MATSKPRARRKKPVLNTRLKKGSAAMAAAVALVGAWEGMKLVAYKDIVGVPTVCFGETRGVKMSDAYTKEQCQVMLGDGLVEFEAGMRRCLNTPDKVPDGPYIAALSLSYNIGTGAFCRSTVRKEYNLGNYRAGCDAFMMWNRAGGRVVKGLTNRRRDERRICLNGIGNVAGVLLPPPDRSPWWRFGS